RGRGLPGLARRAGGAQDLREVRVLRAGRRPMDEPEMIEMRELTTYQVAPDGSSVLMGFVDADGRRASIIVPMANLQRLAFTIPKMVSDALQAAYGNPALRLVHKVDLWKVERGDDGKSVILTFATPDHFQMSFAVEDKELAKMADSVVEYEIEACGAGLGFH